MLKKVYRRPTGRVMGRCSIDSKACDRDIDADMEGTNIPTRAAIQRAIQSAFRGKPVTRVELFGSSARGQITPDSDVDLLVTPSPEATRHDLFIMAADAEDALGRRVDFLVRSDVEAMKDVKARDLILKSAVAVYVP